MMYVLISTVQRKMLTSQICSKVKSITYWRPQNTEEKNVKEKANVISKGQCKS